MEEKIQQILDGIKEAYPKLEVSVLPTKRRGDMRLIVIKGFDDKGDIDDWSEDIVCPILWDTVKPLIDELEEGWKHFRVIFVRDNEFVLHSPDVGFGNVFAEMHEPVQVSAFGYEEWHHYVGESRQIQEVLDFLTQTPGIYF